MRAKKRIYTRISKIVLRYIDLPCTFCMCDYVCDWMWVEQAHSSKLLIVIIVLWQGRKISSMYRGTKQNCCKYLRLLPSRILIGSTCIIHSLVHWSFGDFWFIEKKEEKDEYVFNSNRYFALSHCRMPNSIRNSLESIYIIFYDAYLYIKYCSVLLHKLGHFWQI